MLFRVACSIAVVIATVLIHAGCTAALLGWLRPHDDHRWAVRGAMMRAVLLAAVVSLMSVVSGLESALWAGLYVMVGALPSWGEAFYFSLVTFTSLGYGDVTLGPEWRVVGAFEAANGIIMFGWTTALIVAVVQHMLGKDGIQERRS